jgi:ankyrin repeat protein
MDNNESNIQYSASRKNYKQNKGALFDVIERSDFHSAEELIKNKIDLDCRDNEGNTPLMIAAKNGDLKIVSALISAGAQVNLQNNEGMSALMFAVLNNQEAIIHTLIQARANLNLKTFDNITALMLAIFNNTNPSLIRSLINAGAKVNVCDKTGWTCLMEAAKSGNLEIVKILVESNISVNLFPFIIYHILNKCFIICYIIYFC